MHDRFQKNVMGFWRCVIVLLAGLLVGCSKQAPNAMSPHAPTQPSNQSPSLSQVPNTVAPLTPTQPPSQVPYTVAPDSPTQFPDQSANFILHVLNSSEESVSVGIQVYIDGKLEIDETFSSEVPTPDLGIAPHKTFQFQLQKGKHTLKATSKTGGASLEQQFEVIDQLWAILGYEWWSGVGTHPAPRQFEFYTQNTPILFE